MLSFEEIERKRKDYRIRQRALADRAGIHPATYSTMKRPMPRGPTVGILIRLEKALTEMIAEMPAAKPRRRA